MNQIPHLNKLLSIGIVFIVPGFLVDFPFGMMTDSPRFTSIIKQSRITNRRFQVRISIRVMNQTMALNMNYNRPLWKISHVMNTLLVQFRYGFVTYTTVQRSHPRNAAIAFLTACPFKPVMARNRASSLKSLGNVN